MAAVARGRCVSLFGATYQVGCGRTWGPWGALVDGKAIGPMVASCRGFHGHGGIQHGWFLLGKIPLKYG